MEFSTWFFKGKDKTEKTCCLWRTKEEADEKEFLRYGTGNGQIENENGLFI